MKVRITPEALLKKKLDLLAAAPAEDRILVEQRAPVTIGSPAFHLLVDVRTLEKVARLIGTGMKVPADDRRHVAKLLAA